MFARLRVLLLKLPVLVVLGLTLCYFLFAWLAFPSLAKWGVERYVASKTGHVLTLEEPRFDPLRLSLTLSGLKLAEPDGAPLLGFRQLHVDFETSSLFRWAWTLADVSLDGADARLVLRPDGSLNWTAFLDAFKEEEEEDKPLPRLVIEHISLSDAKVQFTDKKVTGGFEARLDPINLHLTDLSTLPDDKGDYTLATRTLSGMRIRWKGNLALSPVLARGEMGIDDLPIRQLWPYVQNRVNMAPPAGKLGASLSYQVGYADKHLSLVLDKIGLQVAGLALRGKDQSDPAVRLEHLQLSGGRFDLDRRELKIAEVAFKGGRVSLERDRQGRLDLQSWLKETGNKAAQASPAEPAQGSPWQVTLDRFSLDGLAIRLADRGFIEPLTAEVGNVFVGFKANLVAGAGKPELKLDDLAVKLSDLQFQSAGEKFPLLGLGEFSLEGGQFDLADRLVKIGRVGLSGGQARLVRDARGDFPMRRALMRVPDAQARPGEQRVATAADAPWHYTVERIELAGFAVGLRDESVRPALALDLIDIGGAVDGVSDDLKDALPVTLGLRVKQGGTFEMSGQVVPAIPSADLKLKLAGLSLRPAQPYVAQAANLTLASGAVSTQGRLRYGKSLDYRGGFAVSNLLLNETEGGNRFLAWRSLETGQLRLGQDHLDIGTLKIRGLGTKLFIYEDKSVNLKNILKAAPPSASAPAPAKVQAAASQGQSRQADGFHVDIDRVQVVDGEMDFADLSLSLPFATRIHTLNGYFNNISSRSGRTPAQLELEGRVDDYGMARANGQVNLFDPTGYMDIKTVFRNVEMTRLTPYTATFAGRKIASGKLSLDLEYKIKQRQLQGENQVIMDQLTLGERVESPTAKSLPLDLALAILKDSDGRIDLDLPVSGSLDDPEFSYGKIIWKAIVNVITKIATAPFRALGKLLGISGEQLEKIAFDVGDDRLQPPQREALQKLAQAMDKRPGLQLVVHGTYDPQADRLAMQSLQLRRTLMTRLGEKLAEGEDPGPVSTAQPKVQKALESLYAEHLGKEALHTLESKHRQANPEQQAKGVGQLMSRLTGLVRKEVTASPAELATLKGADLHGLLYEQLRAREAVPDERLKALANNRARVVVGALRQAGLAEQRVRIDLPEPVQAEGQAVAVKMVVAAGQVAPVLPAGNTKPAEAGKP